MRNLLLTVVLLTSVITHAQNVAINNDASLPHSSAILDIKSGTKGLLIPRMTTTTITTIVNPAKGLMVLDTVKNQLLVNMGTPALPNWQTIVASSGWSLSGNAGIDPNTQFIGTLDAKPFIIRVNNFRSGLIDSLFMNASYGYRALDSVTYGVANTAIGFNSLLRNTIGHDNTGIGWSSLRNNSTGFNNVGVGSAALYSNTNGSANVAVGNQALYNNTMGYSNTASGDYSLYNNTTGFSNTASGAYSLFSSSTGIFNTAIGQRVLLYNTTGSYNTGVGSDALFYNSSGNNNVAIGSGTLAYNESGYSNVAMGVNALYNSVNRSNLIAIGDSALFNNGNGAGFAFEGTANTAVGSKALYNNTTGYNNTGTGFGALTANSTGYGNTGTGSKALSLNATGFQNTAMGSDAMSKNTTGSVNSSFGVSSLFRNINGYSNTAMGSFSLFNNTDGSNNTAFGLGALNNNVLGSLNTGLGNSAELGSANLNNATVIGALARVDCSNCMVLGSINGINGATSNVNVGIGTTSPTKLFEVVGPASGTPVTLMIANRGGFGPAALEFISDYGAPNQWRPGYIRTNDGGVYTGVLEFYTNGSGAANLNTSVKGFEVRSGAANTATGTVGVYSDARLKNNITAFTDGLNVISKINPVQFYYNADAPFKTDQQQVGIIAQELENFAPYMVEKNKQNGYDDLRSVNNQAYTFLLINAVKEQQQQIEKQQNQIEKQQKQIETSNDKVEKLNQQVAELKKMMEQLLK